MIKSRLHFLGIAGHAMRGIALAARNLGYEINGTDESAVPPGSTWLDEHKIKWWAQSDPNHLDGVDKLVVSGGSGPDHPLIQAAKSKGIPILSFAQLIDELLGQGQRVVIAGTHGKTTTSALLAWILDTAGLEPSFVIGAPAANFDSTMRLSASKYAVIEGDEYQASQLDTNSKFTYYHPDYLLITSIEMDHPDFFKDIGAVKAKFTALASQMSSRQVIVYNVKDTLAAQVAKSSPAQTIAYGPQGDYEARDVSFSPQGISFSVHKTSQPIGQFRVGLYGQHNVDNALAAVAIANMLGVKTSDIQQAFTTFRGTYRRFTIHKATGGFRVIDDYAHHPTAVAANITAVKEHFGGHCIAVLQPHTFSRTKALASDFIAALKSADKAYLLDIEAAREQGQGNDFSSANLADGKAIIYQPNIDTLANLIKAEAKADTTVLVMSVSNQDKLIELLVTD